MFNLKSAISNQGWNMSGHVTAFERQFEQGFASLLPSANGWIGGESMLKEDQLAARFQDAANSSNRFDHPRNCAHGESADNRVHTCLAQWDSFSWQVHKLHV